ncbi:Uncharacterised protein [Salmonella enterica subsp. enterica serovar Typhi]|nr:Uncharacterised protein [Salmonella enterica subsp. enterica serovar Typhi]
MRQRINKVTLFAPDSGVDQHKARQRIGIIKEHHIAHAPGNRRQVPVDGDQHDQHHAPPEDRHRVTGQRQANGSVIEDRTALHCGQHAHRNPHGDGKNHGADAKFQRRFKARYELVPHGDSAFQRDA